MTDGTAGPERSAPPRFAALVVVLALLSAAVCVLLVVGALGSGVRNPRLSAVLGALCLTQATVLAVRGPWVSHERDVWRGLVGTVALVGLGLLAEAVLDGYIRAGRLDAGLLGAAFHLGAALACLSLYQGMIRWNRFESRVSDPGDWLNGLSAIAVFVAGGALLVRVTDAPMSHWAALQVNSWLADTGAAVVLVGTATTVASLGGLARDKRIWGLAAALGTVATMQVVSALPGDVDFAVAGAEGVWVVVAIVVSLCSLRRPAPLVPRVSTSQAPTMGALVVLVAGITVLCLHVLVGGARDLATTWLAAGASLGGATRMLHVVRQLSGLAESQREARTDDLTGISNRRAISSALTSSVAGEEATALLVVDLDRFKVVNDRHGHAVGDEVLQILAARLDRGLPPLSTLGRLGGDEFAVLLTGPDAETGRAVEVGQWLHEACLVPVDVGSRRLRLGSSIGIAFDDHGGNPDGELMRRADAAMYVAKRTGGGVSVYDEESDRRTQRDLALLEDLHLVFGPDAPAGGTDQIVVHYQPQVEVATGAAAGVEALVRWQHPRLGLLYPDSFLDLVERDGLMADLTSVVLQRATTDAVGWHRSGHLLRVAVNLSTSCLADPDLLTTIDRVTSETGIDLSLLTLEITETTLMSDPDLALEITRAIASRGIGISIDDYGTGYSSLAYLNDLPAEELKLDRSFTARLTGEPRTAAIVAGTIDLAHRLGLRLVAEGVEDAATLRMLAGWGCDQTQGYLHARPMPVDSFREWLTAGAPTALSAG